MDKTNTYVLAALCLVLGLTLAFGYHLAHPVVLHDIVEKEIIKNVTVEVPVAGPTVDSSKVLIENAVKEYYAQLDDSNQLTCSDNDFSISDVSQSGDLKDVTISVDKSDRHDTVTTVSFTIKDKFDDGSSQHKCYRTDSVVVKFHSKASVDTEVEIN